MFNSLVSLVISSRLGPSLMSPIEFLNPGPILTVTSTGLQVHGVLTAISWGTLMPLGVIIARYLKVFKSANPAWFYLHVTCQCSAYIIGVAGWGTGLKLGSDSTTVQYDAHRNIGITLFVLGTLQVHNTRKCIRGCMIWYLFVYVSLWTF